MNNDNFNNVKENHTDYRKKKKLKFPFVVLIVILATLLGGFGVFAAAGITPKIELFNAINKTKEEAQSKKRLSYDNIFIDDNYIQNLYKGAVHMKGNIKLKSIAENNQEISEMSILKGAGINFDYSYDVPNKKLLFNNTLSFMGLNLIDYNIFTDNNKIKFSVPNLYDKWISMEAKDIQKQYNNSAFAKDGNFLEDREISLEMFDDNGFKYMFNYKLLYKMQNSFENLDIENLFGKYENLSVEKLDEKKSVDIDNGSVECIAYSVNIPKDDILTMGNDIKYFFENNSDFKDFISEIAKYQYIQSSYIYESAEEIESSYFEIINDFTAIFDYISFDDVNAMFYVDDNGKIIDFNIKTTIYDNENFNENIDILVSGGFKGKDNATDNGLLKVELSSKESTDKATFELNNIEKRDEENNINNELFLSFKTESSYEQDIDVKVSSFTDFNEESGKILSRISVLSEDNTIAEATLDGYIKSEDKNKSIDFNFDDVTLKIPSSQNFVVSFSCNYTIQPLNSEIIEPLGEEVEIFNADEQEIEQITADILDKISFLSKSFENITK